MHGVFFYPLGDGGQNAPPIYHVVKSWFWLDDYSSSDLLTIISSANHPGAVYF